MSTSREIGKENVAHIDNVLYITSHKKHLEAHKVTDMVLYPTQKTSRKCSYPHVGIKLVDLLGEEIRIVVTKG